MISKKETLVTHECDLGFFVTECLVVPEIICEPDEHYHLMCKHCPRSLVEGANRQRARVKKLGT